MTTFRSIPRRYLLHIFDIMPSISTHVLFYLMQEFAYSFNHAAANRLTEWHSNFNKCWIRGNKGKHILLHIINKEKIAKKNKNSAWIFIKIQLKKKKKTSTTATTKEFCLHFNGKTFPEQTPDDQNVGSYNKNWNFPRICYCP